MYNAPIKDMLFVQRELAGIDEIAALPGVDDAGSDTMEAVLHEAEKFCSGVIAPLNVVGDRNPSRWQQGEVTASPGIADAWRQFVEGGWQGVQHPAEYGGHGLPKLAGTPIVEMLSAANLAFALCPLLTDGAIEALLTAGSDAQKTRYLPKLVSGEWTGTMNLTEPQAGSDLALIRTRAVPHEDGTYRIFGTKIFITWGERDMAENILHLVLARTPDAPEGVKGISLFLVPKRLPGTDGTPAQRNDVECISIEHKLGIRASPTAVLQFGQRDGAIGELIGEENRGLEYMFIMMNTARFTVGMQGIAISERAYQKAVGYARERIQSRPVDGSSKEAVPIIRHPDVRRMLTTMRALTEAPRALAYVAAAHCDNAHRHPDASAREFHRARYEFLVPVVKGWSTESSLEVTSLGVQIHGGMGFIEETGASQYYRDARILPIYEGTTAIQANDLIGRKTLRDGGAVVRGLIEDIGGTVVELGAMEGRAFASMGERLEQARRSLEKAVDFVIATAASDPNAVFCGSVPYLKLVGIVLGGWQMARAMLASARLMSGDCSFHEGKIATARFFAEHVLPQSLALEISITAADSHYGMLALADERF